MTEEEVVEMQPWNEDEELFARHGVGRTSNVLVDLSVDSLRQPTVDRTVFARYRPREP